MNSTHKHQYMADIEPIARLHNQHTHKHQFMADLEPIARLHNQHTHKHQFMADLEPIARLHNQPVRTAHTSTECPEVRTRERPFPHRRSCAKPASSRTPGTPVFSPTHPRRQETVLVHIVKWTKRTSPRVTASPSRLAPYASNN